MKKIIGIDLGTTNSVVSIMEGTNPKILENDRGGRSTPSAVWFRNDEIIVGELAKNNEFDKNVVTSIKRKMGTDELIEIDGIEYRPEQISAMIISNLKELAEKKLGCEITEAVITVPAYFGDVERKATKQAGEIAGLEIKRIINEPTAAALAHGFDKVENEEKILVFDLGGGTFDVSILEVMDGTFEVLSTAGDKDLGGDDFDDAIVNEILNDIKSKDGLDFKEDIAVMKKIKQAAEIAKKELSNMSETMIIIPMLTFTDKGPYNYETKFTREKFEEITLDLREKTIPIVNEAITNSGLELSEISEIILVGGSTRIPSIKKIIEENFDLKINESSNPDEIVSIGAAIQGGVLSGGIKDILLLDVTSLDLGIKTYDGLMSTIIKRNTTIPAINSSTYTTVEDNQTKINIEIFQGNNYIADENKNIGSFVLDGIIPDKAGIPQVDVQFKINSNGILVVEAVDKNTGISRSLTVENSLNLSDDEVKLLKLENEIKR